MYLKAAAAGGPVVLSDVHSDTGDWQPLYLRGLLPVLAMGSCILSELKKK